MAFPSAVQQGFMRPNERRQQAVFDGCRSKLHGWSTERLWGMANYADERSQASSKRDGYVKAGYEDVAPARSLLFSCEFTDVVGAWPFGLTDA